MYFKKALQVMCASALMSTISITANATEFSSDLSVGTVNVNGNEVGLNNSIDTKKLADDLSKIQTQSNITNLDKILEMSNIDIDSKCSCSSEICLSELEKAISTLENRGVTVENKEDDFDIREFESYEYDLDCDYEEEFAEENTLTLNEVVNIEETEDFVEVKAVPVYSNESEVISEENIDAYIEQIQESYGELSERRVEVIRRALSYVGKGTYDQGSHWKKYSIEDEYMTTDCSGFVSNMYYDELQDMCTTATFKQKYSDLFQDYSEVTPGDILIKYNGGTPHALLYIGKINVVDENGNMKNIELSVDCSRANESQSGNIYLRDKGYYEKCVVLNPELIATI